MCNYDGAQSRVQILELPIHITAFVLKLWELRDTQCYRTTSTNAIAPRGDLVQFAPHLNGFLYWCIGLPMLAGADHA
jgi:hypothetical protein